MAFCYRNHFYGLPLPNRHLVDLKCGLVLANRLCGKCAYLGAKRRAQIVQRKHFGVFVFENVASWRFKKFFLADLSVTRYTAIDTWDPLDVLLQPIPRKFAKIGN